MSKPIWSIEDSVNMHHIASVCVSPDGRRLAFSARHAIMNDEASRFIQQVYVLDESACRKLTFSESTSRDPKWAPDGRRLAFISDRSEKKAQVWLIDPDGGEARQITRSETPVAGFNWLPDGEQIVYAAVAADSEEEKKAKKRGDDARRVDVDVKRMRLWLHAVAPVEEPVKPSPITPPDLHVRWGDFWGRPIDLSADGRFAAVTVSDLPLADDWVNSRILVIDLKDPATYRAIRVNGACGDPCFSPDGRTIAFAWHEAPISWAFNRHFALWRVEDGAITPLAETPNQMSHLLGWSGDGSRLLVHEADRIRPALGALPASGGDFVPLRLPELCGFPAVHLNAGATHLGYVRQGPTDPPEASLVRLDSTSPPAYSDINRAFRGRRLPKIEWLTYPGEGGVDIDARLIYPLEHEAGRPSPLVLQIHGGPTGLFMEDFPGAGFYPSFELSAHGYAVLQVNPRGSGGLGFTFRDAIHRDWGGIDYRDLMNAVDHVIERGVADPDQLYVFGWSYGGYMTAWIVGQTDRFRAAVMGAGLSNLVSFTGTADIPGFLPSYFSGELWEAGDILWARSPLTHVQNVRTPLLILHGEADVRVPISQGYEFYTALERRGAEVEMVAYPRMPHVPSEPRHRADVARRQLAWLEKHRGVADSRGAVSTPA